MTEDGELDAFSGAKGLTSLTDAALLLCAAASPRAVGLELGAGCGAERVLS